MRLLLLGCIVTASGCSFVLDKGTVQCTTNADCEQFDGHPICSSEQVCVASGLGPPACFFGTPTSTAEYNNACTTSQYIVFDNCARLGLCNGAALPPLVAKP